jgi:hypothetical protein
MGQKGLVEANIHRRLILKWKNFKSQSVHGKFWHRAENVGVQVCMVNCGATWKNIVCVLKLALCSVHTHNNGVHGVHSIGIEQWSLVAARTMWVNVDARQLS